MEPHPIGLNASAQEGETVHVEASFKPLIPRFLANRKKEVTSMREALAARDLKMVRTISHGMKGVGGSYGFDRLTEIAAVIEQAARSGDASAIERELPILGAYLDSITVVYE
jgi:HPt (histidine-containing phosphotransfer) domain-containing protein